MLESFLPCVVALTAENVGAIPRGHFSPTRQWSLVGTAVGICSTPQGTAVLVATQPGLTLGYLGGGPYDVIAVWRRGGGREAPVELGRGAYGSTACAVFLGGAGRA